MSPEMQRIAIAEACGWIFRPICEIPTDAPDYMERKSKAVMCWVRPLRDEWQTEQLPDYLNDLDAMQNAVFCLSKIQIAIFQQHLGKIAASMSICFCECLASMWAEAFLRTLGKWEESV